jgi:hypothetical protein
MFTEMARRFDLLSNQFERFGDDERFVTWSGRKR